MNAARTALLFVALVGCGKRNFNEGDDVDATIVTCPVSYTAVAGAGDLHYGPLVPMGTSWIAAQMSCINEGARLAIPTSRYEALALADIASSEELWIGVSRIDSGEVWTTVYGTPATYLPWTSTGSQPDGDGECVVMNAAGGFFDRGCATALYFVCECRGQ